MKKHLFSFLIVLAFVFSVSAQKEEPILLDELSSFWKCEDVRARSDAFLAVLQNNPKATGFVIVYEGRYTDYPNKKSDKSKKFLPRRGEARFRTNILREHFKYREFSLDRILFIDGGFREEHKVQFWLVPDSAKLPKPSPNVEEMKFRKGKPNWECNEPF